MNKQHSLALLTFLIILNFQALRADQSNEHPLKCTSLTVFHLEVPNDSITIKISCHQCKSKENRCYPLVQNEKKCDQCRDTLTQTTDDNSEVVQNKLKMYNQQTAPLSGQFHENFLIY